MQRTLPWILSLFLFPIALSASAVAPTDAHCEARATRVVAQLEREAGERLPFAQARLAWQAAKASCEAEPAPEAASSADAAETAPVEVASAEPEGSVFGRFVAGLFSMEPRNVQKRPGGKYRYIDKD